MSFKELKEGDLLYIVNEGKNFGIRIEEHVIKGITKECGDLVIKLGTIYLMAQKLVN